MNKVWNHSGVYSQYKLPDFSIEESRLKVDFWDFLMFSDSSGYRKDWDDNEFQIFLSNKDLDDESVFVDKKSCLKITNNYNFSIFNFSLYCLKEKKEIFFWKSIPSSRFLKLKFLKEGSYNLHFNSPDINDFKEGFLKIKVTSKMLSPSH